VKTAFDAHVDSALIARSLDASAFGSVWLDMPRPDYPALAGALTCDLLIVGGGYTGLWTAVQAAQRNPGQRIV
jgi:NADPH-dependent 2,4-dienoyl-CoA reductase/sulfur reductase-like enzyme